MGHDPGSGINPHIGIGVGESGGVHSPSTAARFNAEADVAPRKNTSNRITGVRRVINNVVIFISIPSVR